MSELRQRYNLKDLLTVSGILRNSYYYFMNDASKTDKYAYVRPVLKRIFHQNKGRYGYRRIRAALKKKGLLLNHKTVLRLMNEENLYCMVRVK